RCALCDRARGENVVDPPADIALAHVAPRWPPGEQRSIVGIERARDVNQGIAEQRLEERALFIALTNDAGLALAGMHVDVGAGNVDVAAQDEVASLLTQRAHPVDEAL